MNNDVVHAQSATWALVAVAGLEVCSAAAESAPRLDVGWLRDIQVTVYARRALAEDPVLGPLNLGVTVRDGIATVWGPIPNAETARAAIKCVEGVRGVLQVRGDFYPPGPKKDEPFPDVPFVFDAPTRTESASPDRESGQIGNLTGRLGPGFPTEPAAANLHAAVSLLPPVALPETAPPPTAAEALAAAIERLRQGEQRFRGIATELKDDAVLLRGSAARAADVMAFAQALAHLPGVARVVVLNGVP